MIKILKRNQFIKVSVSVASIIGMFFLFNLAKIIIREEASRIDAQTKTIQESIDLRDEEKRAVTKTIQTVKTKYEDYLLKLNEQKNLTIDANKLNSEIQEFVNLLNKYYDNNIFKIRVQYVKQDDEYINIGNICFAFDFNHDYRDDIELSKKLEDMIIKNIYFDLINNFKKDLSILEEKTNMDLNQKIINISYIKEK